MRSLEPFREFHSQFGKDPESGGSGSAKTVAASIAGIKNRISGSDTSNANGSRIKNLLLELLSDLEPITDPARAGQLVRSRTNAINIVFSQLGKKSNKGWAVLLARAWLNIQERIFRLERWALDRAEIKLNMPEFDRQAALHSQQKAEVYRDRFVAVAKKTQSVIRKFTETDEGTIDITALTRADRKQLMNFLNQEMLFMRDIVAAIDEETDEFRETAESRVLSFAAHRKIVFNRFVRECIDQTLGAGLDPFVIQVNLLLAEDILRRTLASSPLFDSVDADGLCYFKCPEDTIEKHKKEIQQCSIHELAFLEAMRDSSLGIRKAEDEVLQGAFGAVEPGEDGTYVLALNTRIGLMKMILDSMDRTGNDADDFADFLEDMIDYHERYRDQVLNFAARIQPAPVDAELTDRLNEDLDPANSFLPKFLSNFMDCPFVVRLPYMQAIFHADPLSGREKLN